MSLLQQEFGKKFGETLHQLSLGKDDKPLNFGQIRKSVSAEVNYGIRFKETAELETFLGQLCQEVHNRLLEARRKGKCVTLKYMVRAADAPVETAKFMGHGVCDVVNKSTNLLEFTSEVEVIKKAVLQLNNELNIPPEELRGIGVQVTKLDGSTGPDPKDSSSRLKEMFSKVQPKKKKKEPSSEEVTTEVNQPEVQMPSIIISPLKANKKVVSPVKRGRPKKTKNVVKTKAIKDLLRPVDDDLDQNVLNELPEEFRAEAIRSHRMLRKFNSDTKITVPGTIPEEPQTVIASPSVPTIDEDFLAALPADIRREVEMDMGINRSPEKEKVKETVKEKTGTVVSADNIFIQSNWKDVIEAWIETSEEPDENDIAVVVGFWKELIKDKRMVEVYSQFRYFYR